MVFAVSFMADGILPVAFAENIFAAINGDDYPIAACVAWFEITVTGLAAGGQEK